MNAQKYVRSCLPSVCNPEDAQDSDARILSDTVKQERHKYDDITTTKAVGKERSEDQWNNQLVNWRKKYWLGFIKELAITRKL